MKPRTPKRHGRLQDRPAKDSILLHLRAMGPVIVSDLARKVCLTSNCTRQHLFDLMATGEAFQVPGTNPMQWSHQPCATPSNRPQAPTDTGRFMHLHRPAGTWQADHAHAVASVFSLGGI